VNIPVSVQGRSLGEVARQAEAILAKMEIPPSFSYEIGGSARDMADSFKWLALAFSAAALIVYMVMASLFESLRAPFIIFLTLPLGLTGVIGMLFLTGTTLSVVALIGVIMLAGIREWAKGRGSSREGFFRPLFVAIITGRRFWAFKNRRAAGRRQSGEGKRKEALFPLAPRRR
jgi:hypothetical protein